jgi:hypothetical protein
MRLDLQSCHLLFCFLQNERLLFEGAGIAGRPIAVSVVTSLWTEFSVQHGPTPPSPVRPAGHESITRSHHVVVTNLLSESLSDIVRCSAGVLGC